MTDRRSIQRLLSLICLWAFTVGQALLGPSAVWCRDSGTGRVHLEVACIGVDGCHAAMPATGDAHDGGASVSEHEGDACIDVAVVQMAIRADRGAAFDVAALTQFVQQPEQACVPCTTASDRSVHAWRPSEVQRPPDPLGLIQYVILVV